MIVIGIDPHKSTHTATAVDPVTNTDLGSIRIDATPTDYKKLVAWAKTWLSEPGRSRTPTASGTTWPSGC